ncbi:hypothetical protein BJ170DRAFT_597165 [Xylariales sp. AK1849]|nr:hypothetical protein BJ170DRAFT_597165 [Xylariales sp. AK1849]
MSPKVPTTIRAGRPRHCLAALLPNSIARMTGGSPMRSYGFVSLFISLFLRPATIIGAIGLSPAVAAAGSARKASSIKSQLRSSWPRVAYYNGPVGSPPRYGIAKPESTFLVQGRRSKITENNNAAQSALAFYTVTC